MSTSGWKTRKPNNAATRQRARQYASLEHRATRKARIAASTPSDPCSCLGYCGHHHGPCPKPIGSSPHLPHLPDRTGYYPGLWCPPCNRREAARRGARMVNTRRTPVRTVLRRTLLPGGTPNDAPPRTR